MSGFFRSFDVGEECPANPRARPQDQDDTAHQQHGQLSYPSVKAAWGAMSYRLTDRPGFWPLDDPPTKLWNQGENFADLLTMLLRMRALPPKVMKSPDGTLTTIQDYPLPVHVNGRPVREQIDDQTKIAGAWLDPMRLQVGELLAKRDGSLLEKENGTEAWDMKFVAKALLPEKMK